MAQVPMNHLGQIGPTDTPLHIKSSHLGVFNPELVILVSHLSLPLGLTKVARKLSCWPNNSITQQ